MAARHALLLLIAALGLAGCTTAIAGQATSAAHPVLRFRAVLTDPDSGQPLQVPVVPPPNSGKNTAKPSGSAPPTTISSPATSTSPQPQGAPAPTSGGVADPNQAMAVQTAKAVRQNPAVASDPAARQAAVAATDCAKPDPLAGHDDADKPLVTCDKTGQYKYVLGPSFLDGSAIQSATSGYDQQQAQWIVNLTFKPDGARTWADYTGRNIGQQVAFLLDGQVQSAPRINQQIIGNTEISGSFTEQSAKDLAAALGG